MCSADVAANYHHGTASNSGADYPLDVHTMFFAQTGSAQVRGIVRRILHPTQSIGFHPAPPTYNEPSTSSSTLPAAPPSYDDVMKE